MYGEHIRGGEAGFVDHFAATDGAFGQDSDRRDVGQRLVRRPGAVQVGGGTSSALAGEFAEGHMRRYRDWSMANRPKATNPRATAMSRKIPNGWAKIACSAPSKPCACCWSNVSAA